jgi:predicted RNA-binding protein (TIGR00451 family)
VDRGAIKHIINGADVMCRGLTTPGANMEDVDADVYVVYYFIV